MEANAGDAKDIGSTASDGRYSTGFTGTIFGGLIYDIFIDLGTIYWLDTLHFLNDGKSGFEHMAVDVSTGQRAPDGSIKWTRVAGSVDDVRLIQQGRASYKFREFRIDPVRARYIRAPFGMPVYTGTQSTTGARFITLTELLLYGEGYVPEVLLTSDLVLLGGTKNLVSIDWNAETPRVPPFSCRPGRATAWMRSSPTTTPTATSSPSPGTTSCRSRRRERSRASSNRVETGAPGALPTRARGRR